MDSVEVLFRFLILFEVFSRSYSASMLVINHPNLMSSIRNGDVDEFDAVVADNPGAVNRFIPSYWTMALRGLKIDPESPERLSILRSLFGSLANKNELVDDCTPLVFVTFLGDVKAMEIVLAGSEIDFQNSKKETALIIAMKYRFLYKARMLLENGADPNTKNSEGLTALHYACVIKNKHKRQRAITFLLQNYADVPVNLFPNFIRFKNCDLERVKNKNVNILINLNADEMLIKRLIDRIDELGSYFLFCMFLCACGVSTLSICTVN